MKQFLLILVAATLIFMALAMAQEWEVFSQLFVPSESASVEEVAELPEVDALLHHFNPVITHYYRYGGDERFMDRLPAAESVKAEIRADQAYLAANGISQALVSKGSSTVSRRSLAEGVRELIVEEEWGLQYQSPAGQPVGDRPMSFVVTLRYVVRQMDDGWQVVVMEPSPGA